MPPCTILKHSAEEPPPKSLRSMSTVLRPRSDASQAAAAPKAPPPMIARSNSRSARAAGFRCMPDTGDILAQAVDAADSRHHWDEPGYLYAGAYQSVAEIVGGQVQPSGIP